MTEQINVLKRYEPFILGKCQCGCGTDIDIFSPKSKGRKIGYLRRFLNSSHALRARNQTGENNSQWKGGEPVQDKDGYWLIYSPDHPHRNSRNKLFLHRLLYENYLSIMFDEQVYLPEGSEIHHINKDKEDNSLINLQFMPNVVEHRKEHRKNYDGVICSICGTSETGKKENGQPNWFGNEIDGWKCLSCHKKEYYANNREQIRKRKKERYKLTKKK
jgi:hypothetical protein